MAREITAHIHNNILAVIIKPNAPKTAVLDYDEDMNALRIAIAAPAISGKANTALLKYLRKETGRPCQIKSGKTSRKKLVEFSNQP